MAITLNSRFLEELKKGSNTPNVLIELELDSGTKRLGFHGRGALPLKRYLADGTYLADGAVTPSGDNDLPGVLPALKQVSSLQNKLDPRGGFSTRGQQSFVITGRANFQTLVRDEYLKNRRVTRKDGFISRDFTYGDYAPTFTGRIQDWSRRGDDLTIVVTDELKDASSTKIPEENSTKTQHIDYRNTNPVDIMADILSTQLGISPAYINTAQFNSERDLWLNGWAFDRVLTEPKKADEYLNELQRETNSFIVHDGEKISLKVFSPPVTGESIEQWSDRDNTLLDTLSQKSGYKDNFYNRVVFYYDYDESGSDKEENFEAVYIALDAASQAVSQWNDTSTKVIKSKWVRTRAYTQPVNITGITIYHCSRNNGIGDGTLTFTYDAASGNTVQWSAPGGTAGEAVKITKDGRFRVFSSDKTKWIRVIVETSKLPAANRTDSITISSLSGATYAAAITNKLLARYRDPVSIVSFEIDINNVAFNSRFIKPTDLKDLTTDEAFKKGLASWDKERLMLTSVRPDFAGHKVKIEAMETALFRNYAFVGSGTNDWDSATDTEKEHGFIGDVNNQLGINNDPGFYIW